MRFFIVITFLFFSLGCKTRPVHSEGKDDSVSSKPKIGYEFILDSQKGKAFWTYDTRNGKKQFILKHTNLPILSKEGWVGGEKDKESSLETPYLYFLKIFPDKNNKKLMLGLAIEKYVKVTMAEKLKTGSLEATETFDLDSQSLVVKDLEITALQLYRAVYSAMAYSVDFANLHPNVDPSTIKTPSSYRSPSQLFHEQMLRNPR